MRVGLWQTVALLNGVALAMVSSMNAALGERVGQVAATLAFFLPGALVLSVLWALGVLRPGPASVLGSPWWAVVLPGVVNFAFSLMLVFAVPVFGVGTTVVVEFVTQMATALALDHVGFLGQPRTPVSAWPLVGLALMTTGVLLVYD